MTSAAPAPTTMPAASATGPGTRFRPTLRGGALEKLGDAALLRTFGYVGGAWVSASSAATFDVVDPATGDVLATVADLGAAGAASAVDAAAAATPGWNGRLPQERAVVLRRWHQLILAAREDLALIITMEQGKPLAEALGEIDYAASFVAWYAEDGLRLNVESVTSHLPDAEMLVRREALGIAALFTPWNFPSAMLTRKAAAALAAGCTVVAHPSSQTPLSALALAELAERAGMPPGVFNVVPGAPAPIAERLCDDPRVRVVSFTGSTSVGRLIAARCAGSVKRLVMELGGHAPLIVFDDADLDRAVDIAMAAKFATSGQDCLAANRIYVQRGLYDAFCAGFGQRVAALKSGSGLEAGVEIGPLMHAPAAAKARGQIADAIGRGARIVGQGVAGRGPLFVAPTALADVPDDAAIMHEETFGPVAAIAPFNDEDEVVGRANATEYGLVAYVVTRDGARALRLSRALEYGMVAVNRVKITGAPIPFGGVKHSGMGREGGRTGIEAYTDLKYVCLDLT
jgi:aspartate-semialdehyde dehydrogenase